MFLLGLMLTFVGRLTSRSDFRLFLPVQLLLSLLLISLLLVNLFGLLLFAKVHESESVPHIGFFERLVPVCFGYSDSLIDETLFDHLEQLLSSGFAFLDTLDEDFAILLGPEPLTQESLGAGSHKVDVVDVALEVLEPDKEGLRRGDVVHDGHKVFEVVLVVVTQLGSR